MLFISNQPVTDDENIPIRCVVIVLKVPCGAASACIINMDAPSWEPTVIFCYPLRCRASD